MHYQYPSNAIGGRNIIYERARCTKQKSNWQDEGATSNFRLDYNKQIGYYCAMIRSFRCKETEKVFQRIFSKKFPRDIQQRAFMKLNAIDSAVVIEDLRLPRSNRLEALKGDRKGQWSIRINHVVNARRPITAELALRLGRYFEQSPRYWLNLQTRYDMDIAEDALSEEISREVHPRESNSSYGI